jgi:hypothetical protein
MIATYLAWNYMVNVHLALICSTYLAEATITLEHAFTLLSIPARVEFIDSH